MTITYPLSIPSGVIPSRFEIAKIDSVFVSKSDFSLQEKFISMGGQSWIFGVTLPPLNEAKAREMMAFFGKLKGRFGTFLIGDPLRSAPRGSNLGTPVVSAASGATVEAGSNTLDTSGWTTGETGVLLEGDHFQIGTGVNTRLYEVLNDVSSDGSGLATIDIWPDLREDATPSESLVVNNPKGTFRLDQNIRNIGVDTSLFYGTGFTALEAI